MLAKTPNPERSPSVLWTDLLLVAFLVAFAVLARLLPHAPGFMPVAASALFAGRMLRIPLLAPIVPLAAMALSSVFMGPDDWQVTLVVYAAITVPAFAGMVSQRWRGRRCPSWRCCPARCSSSRRRISPCGRSAAVQPRLGGPYAVLHRGVAVSAEYGGRRHVLDSGAVRRRLAGARACRRCRAHANCLARDLIRKPVPTFRDHALTQEF